MTDIKELFDMVTKQTEPDLDSWKDQEDRQRKRARTRRMGAFAVAAVFVAIAAIVFASLRQGDGAGPASSGPAESPSGPTVITNSYYDIATGERSRAAVNLSGARLPEVSPDQRNIAYNTCCEFDAIVVAALDGSGDETITPDDLDGYGVTWIDDETILFQGRASGTREIGELYVANISTGERTMVVDLPDMRHGAWFIRSDLSPDGTTVLFHLPDGRGNDTGYDLWTAPLAGGEATLLREDAGFGQYARDGSIVFYDHPVPFQSDEIWIMDGDGSDARSLVGPGGTPGWPRVSPDGTTVVYENGFGFALEIVDIATGEVTALDASSENPAWFGNDTLIVD